MTDQPEISQSAPTAHELFESVDALMRRNRRAGSVSLPPPEGHIASSVFDEETQSLSAEIEAELAAELAKELSRFESEAPSAASSPLLPETFEPLLAEENRDGASPEAGIEMESAPSTETDATAPVQATIEEPALIMDAPENALESPPSWAEDDLLLWEFASPSTPTMAPEPKAAAEPPFAGTGDISLPEEEPLSSTSPFSDAFSFLSAPEVLASPSQGSVSYMATAPTVVFDGLAAEEKQAVAGAMPEALQEASQEKAAFPEEADWLFAEETGEAAPALDAGAEVEVAEALGLLTDTEMPEAAESVTENLTDIPLPKSAAWRLVEPEAAEEIQENAVENALLSPNLLALEPFQKSERERAEAWSGDTAERGEREGATALFVEPEILEPVAGIKAEGKIASRAESDVHFDAVAAAAEEKAPGMSAAVSHVEGTSPMDTEKTSAFALVSKDSIPASLTTESVSPASAAMLLSERRWQEEGANAVRYSAAQLLTEYQRRNPQAQNIKAVAATPHPVRTSPLPDLALALMENDSSFSTFGEPTREPVKQAAKASPPAAAATPLERAPPNVMLASPSGAGTERPVGEDDYYPLLTDVVSEEELPAAGKA
ncbi:MAG: hypothetical protein FWC42_04660 [Proteobacteria bacterium]|nr:hypothetical protein [Pseudomonadota bacterium]